MINRKNRFKGRKALDYTYRNGKTYKAGPLSLKSITSHQADYRLAVVVSKKVSKSAVVRNRIRRRLFEQLRKQLAENSQPFPCDMILTVFDERVATMPPSELAEICAKLLVSTGFKL